MTDLLTRITGPKCHDHGIRGSGWRDPEGKQVMIVGIGAGREEMRMGIPMVGDSGKLNDAILKACGWDRKRVYVTNLMCYDNTKPSAEDIMGCWSRLKDEVDMIKPKLVILLGQIVSTQFFGDRPFTGGRGQGVRGIIDWYKPWQCHLMPTYHPAALLYGGGGKFVANDLIRDYSKIRRFFDEPPVPMPDFYTVESVEQGQIILNNLPRDGRFVALDIETPLKDEDETAAIEDPISCFSISDGNRTWWFRGSMAALLRWPLDVAWTFHNGPYDTISLAQHTGVLLPIAHDTMYMSNALDERGGVHSLKSNLRETEAVGFYEEEWGKGATAVKKSVVQENGRRKMEVAVTAWDARRHADPEGFKRYNAIDAWGTVRLAQRYYPRMVDDNVADLYHNLLLPAVNTYRHMQRHGVMISKLRTAALADAWRPLAIQKLEHIQQLVRDLGGPPEINPNSSQQMSKFMYGTLRLPGGPSVAKEVIEALAGEHPFIDFMIDYKHLLKALGTYVVGLWPSVKQSTMRAHPWAKLHGTVGGRVAYFNPAINTTPRAASPNPYLQKLRHLVVSPPGRILVEMDYKQAEVWMGWFYSQDPTMWADLQSGDFHTNTAAYVYKVLPNEVTKLQRQTAKASTFGKFFLIGADKFAKQNNITKVEAAQYMQEWDNRYPLYKQYVKDTYKEAALTGELVTITGRKRRYPCAGMLGDTSIMPETTNFKIQATSHDCLMSSIIEAWPVVEAMGGAIILDVHDAMVLEVPADNWQEIAKRVRDIMTKPRFPGLPSLPVEVKVGESWGSMEEVDV